MANRVEDDGTPSVDFRKFDTVIQKPDESIDKFSDEEEFTPEKVEDERFQNSGFISRGFHDPRLISSSNAQLQASNGKTQNNQSQPYSQNTISQKKTQLAPRNIDPKLYDQRKA